MKSYTKNVDVACLTRLILLFTFVQSYAYAQLTTSNVCPSTTVDLTAHVSGTPPTGAVVTWHTGTPASLANQVADPARVGAGTYYAAYYDVATSCYGNTTGSLTVTINACAPVNNICPATTVDLTTHVANAPTSGTLVTWHTGTPASLANQVADPTKVGAGLYYASFYDTATSCYSNTTSPLSVTIILCPAPVADNGSVMAGAGGTAVSSVVANDRMSGQPVALGSGGNATLSPVGAYPAGIDLNTGTGALTVSATTPPGTYTLVYALCNIASVPTCATTTATVAVVPNGTTTPDAGTVSAGTGGVAVASVVLNDLVNGQPAMLGAGGNATVAAVGTYPTGVALNTATGSVSVAVGTAPGSYTIVYQLCDRLTTPTCTTGLVAIAVTPNVTATADAGTINAGTGGVVIADITANDVVNGRPATLGIGGNSTVTTLGIYPSGITLNPATGSISAAAGLTPGVYTLGYQLCDRLTPATCTTTTATVTVTSSLTANPDAAAVVGGAVVQIPVLANDKNPNGTAIINLTQVTSPVLSAPAKGTAVVNADGTVSYTAALGSAGTDVFTYTICDRISLSMCSSGTVTVTISPNQTVALLPKVYLQGALFDVPAINLLMRDDLRAKGYLPLTSPYPAMGMSGLTSVPPITTAVLSTTGTNAIVDWVFVELRSGSDVTQVVDSRSALLQRNGSIVDVDGVSSLTFSVAQTGSYYVSVHHRNHLGVLSAQAYPLSYTATVVDFRNPATPTYKLDTTIINQAQVVVNQGHALWAGNAVYDKNVIYQGPGTDVSIIYQQIINASGNIFVVSYYKLKGYFSGDVNLNGETIFQGPGNDLDFIYQNIIKNHPGNVLKLNYFKIKEQLP